MRGISLSVLITLAAFGVFHTTHIFAEDILVEEHTFGNVTSSYRSEAEFAFERATDCIEPRQTASDATPVKGFTFRIILPDNNYCWLTNVFLSEANYTAMQNNIGVFTVLDRTPATGTQKYTYCELAYWIWNGQHADNQEILKKYPTKYVFPEYCYNEIPNAVIPEFGLLALMILAISCVALTGVRKWKI